MKAIIIARVSTEEQRDAGNSLPAQIERLKRYCQNKGLEIIKEFSFDESAYKDQRTEFDTILDFVIKQPNGLVVCFDKVDRLSRNVFDKRVSTLYDKALRDEIELQFISDGQTINSRLSAVEKFNFSISLGLSKYYSDAISDNVKRAQEQKLRKGEWPSKAPYGYKNIDLANDKTDIVIDEYAAQIVKKVFEWYGTSGYSMRLIVAKLKTDYGIKWGTGTLDRILKEKFHYGVMTWNGKEYPHRYPPIISKLLFDQIQQIKAGFGKKKSKYAGKPYLYRGLFRCGHDSCGLTITPETHKGHHYYHCTEYNGKHGASWLREEEITKQIGQFFKRLQVPAEILQQITDNLSKIHNDKMDFHNQHFQKLTDEHVKVTRAMDNLYEDKLKGSITESNYDRFYQKFRDQKIEIEARLAMLQEAEDNYFITANYVLDVANRAYELFIGSEVEERRQLMTLVLSNLRVEGKKVRLEAKKPFDLILDFADRHEWLPEQDSNLRPND